MKKTIVGIMTIVAMLVAILGTNVNAATMEVAPNQVKVGDEITVTVKANSEVQLAQFEIVYNPEFVEPVMNGTNVSVSAEKGLENTKASKPADGRVRVSSYGETGNNISVKFKALKDTGATPFSVENSSFSADGENPNGETVTNTPTVTIGEAEPTDTPEPTSTPTPEPTSTPTPEPTQKPSNDGKVKYPQTGAPVYAYVAGIALVAIVAGAVVAVRKNK